MLNNLNILSEYSIIILLIYLAIFSTVIPYTVLGESIKTFIQNNKYFQHIFTFIFIFFSVIIFNNIEFKDIFLKSIDGFINNPSNNLLSTLGVSIFLYILYIISSRTSLIFTLIIVFLLLCLFITYAISLKKKRDNNIEEYNKFTLIKNILLIIIIITAITGSSLYALDNKFNIIEFILEKKNNILSKKTIKI